MKRSRIALILATLTFGVLGACSSGGIPAQRYDDLTARRAREFRVAPQGEVLSACGLDTSRSYFAYASTVLDDEARAMIRDLGRCMQTGQLAGAAIVVTGFSDHSGPEEANYALGLERARVVAEELTVYGIAPRRIYLRSAGEAFARGLTPDAQALDRKVEVRVLASR